MKNLMVLALCIMLSSCAAINMSHYQDGRTLGDGNGDIKVGVGTSVSYLTDTTQITPTRFKVKTDRGPSLALVSLAVQAGINDRWDAGGEFFTTLGSTGFKVFTKYAFLDSSSNWGIAAMPLLGFAKPWFSDEEDDEYVYEDDNIAFSVSTFIMEFILPISYHPSKDMAIILNPKVYYHVNFLSKIKGKSANFEREGSGNFYSPGISLGFRYKTFHLEGTAIYMDQKNWVPFFGVSFSSSSFLRNGMEADSNN